MDSLNSSTEFLRITSICVQFVAPQKCRWWWTAHRFARFSTLLLVGLWVSTTFICIIFLHFYTKFIYYFENVSFSADAYGYMRFYIQNLPSSSSCDRWLPKIVFCWIRKPKSRWKGRWSYCLTLIMESSFFHYPSGFFETLLKAAFIYKFIQTTLNQFNNLNSVDSIPIIHAEDAWNGQCVSFVQISASRHVS